ncbi:MAG: GntR family transcriptional regulator [Solirubrobacteraceae bacterium]
MSWESGFTGGPVAGETSSSVAARLIRQGIITGELPPGQALRETELARQMGISRTPIREALRLLQNDGLVEFTPNRGASVKAYSAADLQDVYNLRAALEGYAAQTAAQHITDQQLEALHDSCERYEGLRSSSENLSLLAEENLVFHNTILAAAGSQRLSAMVRQVTALPLIYKSYLTYSPENRRTAEEHHRAILASLKRRGGDEARGMLEDHILWARDLAIAHLALAPAGAEIDGQPQLGGRRRSATP